MRRVCPLKKGCCYGASVRQHRTKRSTCATLLIVGRMVLHCKAFVWWSLGCFKLILCRSALIHRHRPELLDYDSLNHVSIIGQTRLSVINIYQADRHENTRRAFQIAQEHLGIPVGNICIPSSQISDSMLSCVAIVGSRGPLWRTPARWA